MRGYARPARCPSVVPARVRVRLRCCVGCRAVTRGAARATARATPPRDADAHSRSTRQSMVALLNASACAPLDPSLPLFIDASTSEAPPCTAEMRKAIRRADYADVLQTLGLPYCFPAEDSERIPARAALLDALTTPAFGGMPRQTCAMVGSSGLLQGAGLGSQIDAHDVVLRVNAAPARGSAFEADVGRRTTIRMLTITEFSSHLMLERNLLHGDSENLLLAITHPSGYERIAINVLGLNASTLAPRVAASIPSLKPDGLVVGNASLWAPLPSSRVVRTPPWRVAVLNPAVWARTSSLIGATHQGAGRPTTGALALIFALHFCDRVSAFGFSWGSGDPREQAHYYRAGNLSHACRGPSRVCGRVSTMLHSPDHEHILFRTLVETGSIAWYPEADIASRGAAAHTARCSKHKGHTSTRPAPPPPTTTTTTPTPTHGRHSTYGHADRTHSM